VLDIKTMAKVVYQTAKANKTEYIKMEPKDKNIIDWWLGTIIAQKLKGNLERDWYKNLASLDWIKLCKDGETLSCRDHINGRTFVGKKIMESVIKGCTEKDIEKIVLVSQRFVILEKKRKDGTSPNFIRSSEQKSLDIFPIDTFNKINVTLVKLTQDERRACSRGDKEEIQKILDDIDKNPNKIYK